MAKYKVQKSSKDDHAGMVYSESFGWVPEDEYKKLFPGVNDSISMDMEWATIFGDSTISVWSEIIYAWETPLEAKRRKHGGI